MKYLFFAGNTTSNIGNAFFYEGVKYVINKIDNDANIIEAPFSLRNAYNLNDNLAKNELDYSKFINDCDYVILSGPILDIHFENYFGSILKTCKEKGIKVLMLSIGSRNYDDKEIEICKGVLKKYPPYVFTSRDRPTFNIYSNVIKNSYDGICFAFFINDYFKGTDFDKKVICSSIGFGLEPEITFNNGSFKVANRKNSKTTSKFNRLLFALKKNNLTSVDDFELVRLEHRPLRNSFLLFKNKNTMVSHSHEPYLNLYYNSELTVSDRLHAVVATLVFGNKARLFLNSNRTQLLERVGFENVLNEVYSADLDNLKIEKEKMINWLRNYLID